MIGRVWNTLSGGWSMVNAVYTPAEFTPFAEYGWDHVTARRNRYAIYTAYEYNTVYTQLHAFSQQIKDVHRLYKFIRGIYNPVARSKKILSTNIYQGAINRDYLKAGAVPLAYDNEALTPAIQQVIKWSNLEQQLPKYTGAACIKGDTAWWIVDDVFNERVRMEPLDPAKILDAEFDEAGNCKAVIIEYMRADETPIAKRQVNQVQGAWYELQTKPYKFTMKVYKVDGGCRFQTYKDGEPWGFTKDENGSARVSWDVPYDFVPLRISGFDPGEGHWYKNSFYNTTGKIDSCNDSISLLLDQVRKTVVAILKAKGIRKENLTIDMNSPSGLPIFFIDDPEADVEPLVTELDLEGARNVVNDIYSDIKKDMPELMLEQGLDRNERPTAPGIRAVMSPVIGRIEDARRSLDVGLASALQMAVTIGGVRGYPEFRGIGLDTYDKGDMELRIKERPVIADEMTAKERVTLYPAISKMPVGYQRKALQDMNLTEPEIDSMVVDPLLVTGKPNAAVASGEARVEQARLRLDGFNEGLATEESNVATA